MTTTPLDTKFTSTVVPVDPDRAARWLAEFNTHNRKIRKAHVAALARDMSSSRWSFNGAPIVFGADGSLLDGQHRLSAIVESGMTISLLVVRGVPNEAQHTMDTGSRRTAADAYTLDGRGKNASRATAVARFALILEGSADGDKVSTAEIFDFLYMHPLIEACIETTKAQWSSTGLTPRVFDYCYWRLAQLDPNDTFLFFRSLCDLTDLPSGSPIAALHRRLVGQVGRSNRRQLEAEAQVALVFKAWNAWRAGRSVSKLTAVHRGGGLMEIPVPR